MASPNRHKKNRRLASFAFLVLSAAIHIGVAQIVFHISRYVVNPHGSLEQVSVQRGDAVAIQIEIISLPPTGATSNQATVRSSLTRGLTKKGSKSMSIDEHHKGVPSRIYHASSGVHISTEFSRQPELIGNAPNLMHFSENRQPSGELLLHLLIDKSGMVKRISVIEASLTRDIQEEIVSQFYKAIYRPGEIKGIPVESEIYFSVQIPALNMQ